MEAIRSLSVGQALARSADLAPDKTAVVDGERRITFRTLNGMADALAARLSELGFEKGDRVAIYMKNSIELTAAFYAAQKLGVIVAWVNPNYRRIGAEFILRNSGAKGVFIFREWGGYDYMHTISGIKNSLPELRYIIVMGKAEGQGVLSLKDLIDQGIGKEYCPAPINNREDLSMLIYTSGTTGKPKGAMISHLQAVMGGWGYTLAVNATSVMDEFPRLSGGSKSTNPENKDCWKWL